MTIIEAKPKRPPIVTLLWVIAISIHEMAN